MKHSIPFIGAGALLIFLTLGFPQEGELIGTVGQINATAKQIIVHSPHYASTIRIGDRLYMRIGEKTVILTAAFPMQTVVKCSLESAYSGYFSAITKGMPVYRFHASVEKEVHKEKNNPGELKSLGGIEFVFIPEGNIWITIGETQREVKLKSYWMSRYEVTQEQYREVMSVDPSKFKGENLPVDSVSWLDAKDFCNRFGDRYKEKTRLPTKAEWLHASRAGNYSKYYWGGSLDGKYCWYKKNSNDRTHPVGKKLPNAWGLYDIIGNVSEWCEFTDSKGAVNPKGPPLGNGGLIAPAYCEITGYCFADDVESISQKSYYGGGPNFYENSLGFRIVIPQVKIKK